MKKYFHLCQFIDSGLQLFAQHCTKGSYYSKENTGVQRLSETLHK